MQNPNKIPFFTKFKVGKIWYLELATFRSFDRMLGSATLPGRRTHMVPDTTTPLNRVDEELMKIMVCPVSYAPLVQVGDWLYSTDPSTRRKYPVRDSIPIMLVDESQVADQEEFDKVMAQAKGAQP